MVLLQVPVPCPDMSETLMAVHIVGGILNTALLSWLAHRRLQADRRDNGKHVSGKYDASADSLRDPRPRRDYTGSGASRK